MSGTPEVVTFQGIGSETINLLKELNSIIFPIKYQVPYGTQTARISLAVRPP